METHEIIESSDNKMAYAVDIIVGIVEKSLVKINDAAKRTPYELELTKLQEFKNFKEVQIVAHMAAENTGKTSQRAIDNAQKAEYAAEIGRQQDAFNHVTEARQYADAAMRNAKACKKASVAMDALAEATHFPSSKGEMLITYSETQAKVAQQAAKRVAKLVGRGQN